MLLRSSSAPILSALVSEGDNDCSAFNKPFAASHHFTPLSHSRGLSSKHFMSSMRRAQSETDLQGLGYCLAEAEDEVSTGEKQHHHILHSKLSIIQEKEQLSASISELNKRCLEKEDFRINRKPCSDEGSKQHACPPTSTASRISAPCDHGMPPVKKGKRLSPLLMASGIGISSKPEDFIVNVGGGFYGYNGGRGGCGGCGRPSSSPHGDSNTTDLYYQRLLQSDPQNPLFLRNYAQFLSEAKHDYNKSEEYYERAILACPDDGEVLSKYAKQVWDVHKDSERAGRYFDQAVKATPDDCYVLASYASFLWQSEEDEEETNKATQTASCHLHKPCVAPSPLMASA